MNQNRERLTVEVPKGWKAQLAEIGKSMERNTSYLTRKALKAAHPTLSNQDSEVSTASEQQHLEAEKGSK